MASIPLGPYQPDRSSANASVLPYVNNVVPTEDGWGPLRGIIKTQSVVDVVRDENGETITDENDDPITIGLSGYGVVGVALLPAPCTGMFAARKQDGTEVIFAGTATALYTFNPYSFAWVDVSSKVYASECRWAFVKFGDEVRVQNGYDFEQVFNIETDTVFADDPDAPICKYMLVISSFLFRFNIVSWAAEPNQVGPNALMCSAFENPGDNLLQNANWCDNQLIPVGDEIMGAVPASGGAHVWLRGGAAPLTILMEGGITFVIGDVDTTRGTSAPYSLCSFGYDRYIVYADDGWWLYNSGFSPVGQGKVNKTFLRSIDQDLFDEILSMNDPENAVIWVSYTNTDGERRMLGYQYNLGLFTASDIAANASFVCRTFIYDSDTPILVANQPRFAIIDEDGQLGYLVGPALKATLRTNKLQFNVDRTFINKAQLNGDALDFSITPVTQDIKGGLTRARPPASPSERSGNVPMRASGRTHEMELNINEGDDWTYVSGFEVAVKKAGGS